MAAAVGALLLGFRVKLVLLGQVQVHVQVQVQVHVRVFVFFFVIACCCCCRCGLRSRVEEREEGGDKPKQSQLIPSAVSLRIAETEQLYQAQCLEESATCCSRPILKLKMVKIHWFLW